MTHVLFHFEVENTAGIGKVKCISNFKRGDPKFDEGTLHMVSWGAGSSQKYLAKIVAYGKGEAELKPTCDSFLRQLNLNLGKDEQVVEMTRSSKKRKRIICVNSSDTNDSGDEISEKRKKKKQKKMSESNAHGILSQLQAKHGSLDETKTNENQQLVEENKLLREENERLKQVIAAVQGLPALVMRLEDLASEKGSSACRSLPMIIPPRCSSSISQSSVPSSSSSLQFSPSPSPNPEPLPSLEQQKSNQISEAAISRCSTSSAKKFTNDLLHGLFNPEYMSTHSVTGGKPGKAVDGEIQKEGIEPSLLRDILNTVQKRFPERTDSEVKSYIRVKFNNKYAATKTAVGNKKNE